MSTLSTLEYEPWSSSSSQCLRFTGIALQRNQTSTHQTIKKWCVLPPPASQGHCALERFHFPRPFGASPGAAFLFCLPCVRAARFLYSLPFRCPRTGPRRKMLWRARTSVARASPWALAALSRGSSPPVASALAAARSTTVLLKQVQAGEQRWSGQGMGGEGRRAGEGGWLRGEGVAEKSEAHSTQHARAHSERRNVGACSERCDCAMWGRVLKRRPE